MQKSEKMNLNLFEETDFVRPEYFNENTQIIDNALFNSTSAVMGTYETYDVVEEADTGVVIPFEKTPIFVFLMSTYGIVMAFRGMNIAFDVTHDKHLDYAVAVEWGDHSVSFKSVGCETLTHGDGNGHYFALVI